MKLGDLAWPAVAARAASSVLVVPLGSTEQHGPHLPLSTDTEIATALAERLAAARPDALVAPAVAFGSSGEHAGFPGTLSIGQAAVERTIVELGRSADDFAGMVLVSAHGGNAEPLRRATATLAGEGRKVLAWSPTGAGGDLHAGRSETSLMLALAPTRVRLDLAVAGGTGVTVDDLRRGGVRSASASGVLGDPSGASAEEGLLLLRRLADDLTAAVGSFFP